MTYPKLDSIKINIRINLSFDLVVRSYMLFIRNSTLFYFINSLILIILNLLGMKMKKTITTILVLIISSVVLSQTLPTETSTDFSGSGNCATCHEPNSSNPNALINNAGNDISPVTLWRSTMMANAARDPFWQAKVSAEVVANPSYADFIEDKCTTCHSPMGRLDSKLNGDVYYSLSEMRSDPLSMDGVSCTVCHQIEPDNLGSSESYSGKFEIGSNRIIYGPFQNPITTAMQNRVNYTPEFGDHTLSSELCATCHTLFTPTLDNEANIVGEIAEQTPYLEWKNSIYPSEEIECQTCHMPLSDDPVIISTLPSILAARQPFAEHYFVGGNTFMLKLLRDNDIEIGVTASKDQFDSTIARTLDLLQNRTAELEVNYVEIAPGELEIKVAVQNLSGHKFPSGYPSRRAWLFVELKNEAGSVVFSSGNWDVTSGEIIGIDDEYEKHYNVIEDQNQVQIYQALMKDVDQNVTYTLLRGDDYIKDNRLPPIGFTTSGVFYDSTMILGLAADDENFNRRGIEEGSGSDTVTYVISNIPTSGSYSLNAKLLYQSIAPRYIEDLFQYDTPEVNKFKEYYNQADKSPVVIDSIKIDLTLTSIIYDFESINEFKLFNSYPNPFNPITHIKYNLPKSSKVALTIYDIAGRKVKTLVNEEQNLGSYDVEFNGTDLTSGIYFYKLQTEDFQEIKKMLLIK